MCFLSSCEVDTYTDEAYFFIVWFNFLYPYQFFLLKIVIKRAILKSPNVMVDLSAPPGKAIKLVLHIPWLRVQNLLYLPGEEPRVPCSGLFIPGVCLKVCCQVLIRPAELLKKYFCVWVVFPIHCLTLFYLHIFIEI